MTTSPRPPSALPSQKKRVEPAVIAPVLTEVTESKLEYADQTLGVLLPKLTKDVRANMLLVLHNYGQAAKKCAEQSFSADDQRSAGCLATDTVAKCSEKLFWWCLKAPAADFHKQRMQMMVTVNELKNALEAYGNKLMKIPISGK